MRKKTTIPWNREDALYNIKLQELFWGLSIMTVRTQNQLQWIQLGLELFAVQEAEHPNNQDITLSYYGSIKDNFLSMYPAIDPDSLLNKAEQTAKEWLNHAFEVYEDFAPRGNNPSSFKSKNCQDILITKINNGMEHTV